MPVGRPSRRPVCSALLTALVAVAGLAPPSSAQTMHYGVVMDKLRDGLADRWSEDLHQVERAYCVTQWWAAVSTRRAPVATDTAAGGAASDDAGVDTVFRVLEVRPADATAATPNGATFACPAGQPELHTHPPATCYADRQDQCYHGGTDAYSCQPSREDVRTLRQRGDEFAIVQCDRNAFVFYYPSQYDTGRPVALSAIPSVFSIAARTHTDAAQPTAAGPAGPVATPH